MLTSCLISLHCWSFCPESFTVNINPLHLLLISALLSDMRECLLPAWRAAHVWYPQHTLWSGYMANFTPCCGRSNWCKMLTPYLVLSPSKKLRWSASEGEAGRSFQCKVISGVFSYLLIGLCQLPSGLRRSDLAGDDLLISFHGSVNTVACNLCVREKYLSLCPTWCFMEEGIKCFSSLVTKAVILVQKWSIELYPWEVIRLNGLSSQTEHSKSLNNKV